MTPKQIKARVMTFDDEKLKEAIDGLQAFDSYEKEADDPVGSWERLNDGRVVVVVATNKFDPNKKLISYFY